MENNGIKDKQEHTTPIITGEAVYPLKAKAWLNRTSYTEFHRAIERQVIGQEALEDITLSIYHYIENLADKKYTNDSILLCAPSGCGKTETFRAVQRYLQQTMDWLPCYQVNMANITQAGFKGDDPSTVIKPLFRHWQTKGRAIVWIDEFDKRMFPCIASDGEDVNASILSSILTILEGCEIEDTKPDSNITRRICTSNTLFIAMGAFDYIRKGKKALNNKHTIGFDNETPEEIDHYEDITREDLYDFGGIPEVIGRFGTIINFHPLSEEAIRKIINKMSNEETYELGHIIKIEEDTIQKLIEESNSKYGVRLTKSVIHNRAMKLYKQVKKSELDESSIFILSESGDKIANRASVRSSRNSCQTHYA